MKVFYSEEQLKAVYSDSLWGLIFSLMEMVCLHVIMSNSGVICWISVLDNMHIFAICEKLTYLQTPLHMCVCILLQGRVFPVHFNFLDCTVCFLMKKIETNVTCFTPPPP